MDITYNCPNFVDQVKHSLEDGNVLRVISLFEDNQNYEDLKNQCWDLIPLITKYLTSKYENDDSQLFRGCSQLVDKIAENSNPEEALLQFIEEIEESEDDTKFATLLFPMLRVLQRIPKNRINSLAWSLNAIQTYLNKIEISENYRETADSCIDLTLRIELLYYNILRFYDLLFSYHSDNFKINENMSLVVSKYLIELFGKPLGYMDLTLSEKNCRVRKIAENIMEKLIFMCLDPYIYLDTKKSEFLVPKKISYGIFLYLLLYENVKCEMIPKVYSSSYVCISSLKHFIEILKCENQLVVEKGLCTLGLLFQNSMKISHSVLELKVNEDFCEILENIIVYNHSENCRQQAFRIFKLYLDSFDVRGQYLLLYNLVTKIKHSGLAGFSIIQYKEILVNLQKSKDANLNCFEGEKLYSFIGKCCHVSSDEYTLVGNADKIISVLNLMRFVVVQEKLGNLQYFKSIVKIWREEYLDKLQILVHKSKRNFQEEKFNIETEKKEFDQKLDLSVCGEILPEISKCDKLHSINMSLNGIEMMESLLERLIELLISKNCY